MIMKHDDRQQQEGDLYAQAESTSVPRMFQFISSGEEDTSILGSFYYFLSHRRDVN